MRIAYNIHALIALIAVPFFFEGGMTAHATDIAPPPPPSSFQSVMEAQAQSATMKSSNLIVAKADSIATLATPSPSSVVPPALDVPNQSAAVKPVSAPPAAPMVIAKADSDSVAAPAEVAPATSTVKTMASGGGLDVAENKIPESVQQVLKRLNKPTDDVTLDDLNSARQAVAKIEILIEIEKHLAELDKVRHERERDTSMASMIPASALRAPYLPPQPVIQQQTESHSSAVMPQSISKEPLELVRVSGGGGHYSAVIKMTGDEAKTVHVGDHLPDGSNVLAISPMEVVLERSGEKHTLHIKNIDTIFGNSF